MSGSCSLVYTGFSSHCRSTWSPRFTRFLPLKPFYHHDAPPVRSMNIPGTECEAGTDFLILSVVLGRQQEQLPLPKEMRVVLARDRLPH